MESAMNGGTDNRIFTIFNTLITNVTHSINKNALNTFDGQLPSILKSAYPIKMDVVIDAGVAIIDFVTRKGYEACNSTNGDVDQIASTLSPYLGQINALSQELGPKYYAAKIRVCQGLIRMVWCKPSHWFGRI